MKQTTQGMKYGIQWTILDQLDDIDFADDIALLSHTHSQTSTLERVASSIVGTDKDTK